MYYIWDIVKSYPKKYWLEYDWNKNPEHLQFLENKIVELNNHNITLYLNRNVEINKFLEYDYVLSDALNLMSNKLAEIIRKNTSNDVQLMEVKAFQNNVFIDNYFVPIVLNRISCIDKSNSIYDKDVEEYTKIVLKKNSLKNHFIVQAKGYDKYIVKEELVSICKKEKVKGVEFYKEPFIDPLYN
jgi:hypothetical protein